MKLEIHIYHHKGKEKDLMSCDKAINNGEGAISCHDSNVGHNIKCNQCGGKTLRNYYIDSKGYSYPRRI